MRTATSASLSAGTTMSILKIAFGTVSGREYGSKPLNIARTDDTNAPQRLAARHVVPPVMVGLLLVEGAAVGLVPGKLVFRELRRVFFLLICCLMCAADMSGNGGVPGSVPGVVHLLQQQPWKALQQTAQKHLEKDA